MGGWVDDFVDVLMTRAYATSTVRRYVRAAAIFSVWLEQQRVATTNVDERCRPGPSTSTATCTGPRGRPTGTSMLSVEHTDYAPVGLTYVLELARRRREPSATLRLDLP